MDHEEEMVEQLTAVVARWIADGVPEEVVWEVIVENMRRAAITLEEMKHIGR